MPPSSTFPTMWSIVIRPHEGDGLRSVWYPGRNGPRVIVKRYRKWECTAMGANLRPPHPAMFVRNIVRLAGHLGTPLDRLGKAGIDVFNEKSDIEHAIAMNAMMLRHGVFGRER